MISKKTSRILYYVIILLAVVLFSEKFIIKTLLKKDPGYTDFTSYFIAADAIKNGRSPYATIEIGENYIANKVKAEDLKRMGVGFPVPEKFAYTYPPFFAALLIPLASFKYNTAFFIWHIINLFIFGFAVFATLKILGSKPLELVTALVFLLFLGSMPSYETFSLGQVNYLVYGLCLLAFIFNDKGQTVLAALMLALATTIKVTPFALLVYFIFFSQRKKFILYYFGFGALFMLSCGALIGFNNFYQYLTFILPRLSGSYFLDNNKALIPLFSRVFLENPMVTPLFISKTISGLFTAGIAASLVFASVIILRKTKSILSYESRVLGFSVALVFMLLLQTLLEIHHLIYAFLPLLAAVYYSKVKPGIKTLCFAGLLVLLNTRGWNAMEHLGKGWWVIFFTAPQILGLLLLFYYLHVSIKNNLLEARTI